MIGGRLAQFFSSLYIVVRWFWKLLIRLLLSHNYGFPRLIFVFPKIGFIQFTQVNGNFYMQFSKIGFNSAYTVTWSFTGFSFFLKKKKGCEIVFTENWMHKLNARRSFVVRIVFHKNMAPAPNASLVRVKFIFFMLFLKGFHIYIV